MQTHDLHRVAREAAELMERLSRAAQQLRQDNRQACEQLERLTQDLPGVLRQSIDQSLRRLADGTVETVQRGLSDPMERFSRQVVEEANRLNAQVAQMAQARDEIQATTRKLAWMVAGTIVAMLSLGAGTVGVLWHYKGEIARHRIDAELLRAYNQADVTLCDGRLCARVEKLDRRFGEYRPVKPRPVSP